MSQPYPFVSSPVAPWHMWGTTQRFDLAIGAGGSVQVVGHQMAKCNYRRADNWRFYFTGRLTGGIPGVGGTVEVYALFDVIAGVGRGMFDTTDLTAPAPLNFRSFCTMHWVVPIGVVPGHQADNRKWATAVLAPPIDDAAPTVRQLVDHIVAEDIQCSARMFIDLAPSPVTVTAELGAFFAPNVHLRPDWFSQAMTDEQAAAIAATQFTGNERGGT